ncbi:hypothetical protein [Streptomyces ardesiacus]|uniref:hypothetical protein n=1 Tax=Streptomyces ardesiacus TaxID=285564 RepID=UPI0006E236E0|nr:hypothetical protein [Streptomyces sp. NBRC 110030]
MSKVALVVLADTESHADLGGVFNALVAAKEFKAGGDDVGLVFDGAGTQWPGVLSDPGHRAHGIYEQVSDVVTGACGYRAKAFDAEDSVRTAHVHLLDEYEGHPTFRQLVTDGYQAITF